MQFLHRQDWLCLAYPLEFAAQEVEGAVIRTLCSFLNDKQALLEKIDVSQESIEPEQLLNKAEEVAGKIKGGAASQNYNLIRSLVKQVTISPGQLTLKIKVSRFCKMPGLI